MLCFLCHIMGIMASGWVAHLKCSSCQGFTSGMLFTITLLEVKQRLGIISTVVAKVYKRLRGIVWERPGVSRISVRIYAVTKNLLIM